MRKTRTLIFALIGLGVTLAVTLTSVLVTSGRSADTIVQTVLSVVAGVSTLAVSVTQWFHERRDERPEGSSED